MRADAPWVLAAALGIGVLACSSTTGTDGGGGPPPGTLPAFVYVADTAGFTSLVRFRNDSVAVLTSGSNNYDPNSAASRIVFTSERDGYPQIYIADVDITTPHRVVHSGAFDYTPALSPSGDSIAYVSTRTGVPRVWLIRAPALNQGTLDSAQMLATGDPVYSPVSAPAWNPMGHTIAYTGVGTGTSQVYVVASGGGTPTRITNEGGGAFSPAWSADGTKIYYIAPVPELILRRIDATGTNPMNAIPDSLTASGPASCNASYCIFAAAMGATNSSMKAIVLTPDSIQVLFPGTAKQEREPAILFP
jgi:dipeptidyl aminopeptidase/acylaminoacyl peptidase